MTIPSGLKLDRILNTALIALKKRLAPVMLFSHVFRDVELHGTDTVQVPFYPLGTDTSRDFNGSYVFDDYTMESRPVIINKRKYQSLGVTSSELARQPVIDLERVVTQKAEKLAVDVMSDIFSVVTVANFGAHIKEVAAGSFDSEDIIDIRTLLNQAHWPLVGRGLAVESAYDGNLLKDSAVKNAMEYGGPEAVRQGRIPTLFGFDYVESPAIAENGEKLVGFVSLPYAVLVGFSPITPAAEVRENMTDYRSVTDPYSGLTLEYRAWGDPDSDTAKRVIEVNYGFAKGDADQLKRITKP